MSSSQTERAAWELEGKEQLRVGVLDWSLLKRLWTYVHPERYRLLAALALLLINQALRLLQPTLVALALDRFLVPREPSGAWAKVVGAFERWSATVDGLVPGGASPLAVLIGTFGAAAGLEFFLRRLQLWWIDLAGQNALLDLRKALFAHLQKLSSSFYDRTPVGRLVGRLTTDIEALQEMFSSGVVTILGDFVNLAAMTAVLLALNWPLALTSFLVVPVLLWLTLWVRGKVRSAYETLVVRRSALASFLHESFGGMPLIQSFRAERRFEEQHASFNDDMRDAQLVAVKWESLLSAITELLGALATALILWFGGRLVLGDALTSGLPSWFGDATGTLTLGVLFLFIDYMAKFFQPLTDLSLKYTVMQNAMTAAAKIFSLMDVDETIPEPASPRVPDKRAGHVEFEDVRFTYASRPDEEVLRSLSFEIQPGEHIAIVGATGSGKTTIGKLLVRLYDRGAGHIRLDGQDVQDFAVAELRSRISTVPQDVFLFEGTVLDNLRLGGRGQHPEDAVDAAAAREAADRLGLTQILSRFPLGLDQPVGERGKQLSSGERQLVAFARALARAPEVVVLDEATSNIDTRTEEVLGVALEELLEGRSALIIAHRLSTIRNCDRILVLDRGELVEQGTHDELLAAGGAYQRLHELQFRSSKSA